MTLQVLLAIVLTENRVAACVGVTRVVSRSERERLGECRPWSDTNQREQFLHGDSVREEVAQVDSNEKARAGG